VHEIVKGCGFEIVAAFNQSVDYFKSPHSGSSRRELVFCFAARKIERAATPPTDSLRPGWLLDLNQPIPMTRATHAVRRNSVFTVGVLSLVDGKNSLRDVAQALGTRWRLQPETLVDPLRAFFTQLPLE